ncbi:glycosyltransferase [Mycobacterium sp. 1245805.9]|uniref:glycosyltransferase n=1 Tax=Mycobacterium sp. 1245805.9 TaxID=1856862 RepID=UPI00080201FF|nr:glycosyltransferase [Mycobacterium sp. 1245805.9]OBI93906.1 glycosyl transferase [Mycobacterium sp. 1245805.9]
MKFALVSYGTRGDIEPCAAVGRELQRRGHDVRVAVPPNLIGFVESAGLPAVAYGQRDSQQQLDKDFLHNSWKFQNPVKLAREAMEPVRAGYEELGAALKALADGVDLLLTGQLYQEVAANVAERYGIPLAALHFYPMRPNGQVAFPARLPAPLVRSTMKTLDWMYWRFTRGAEDAQRRDLGLPNATCPAPQRMSQLGALEIQAYDELCFPGLAAEWNGKRPFVGSLTLELAADTDDEVASWIAAGRPPIYFGFGSTPVSSPAETVAMIADTCAELGERALIYSGAEGSDAAPHGDHVKLVGHVNYSTILPMCRAAVHHGGAGTTAASLRAGLPTLILWDVADQFIWATQVKRLKVGSAKKLSNITRKSLVRQLRKILAPDCVARAREIAPEMCKPAVGVVTAADLLEQTVRVGV